MVKIRAIIFFLKNTYPPDYKLVVALPVLQKTVLSLLDCMLDECVPHSATHRVYYNILEADEAGRPPDHQLFDASCKSALHIIAQTGNKVSSFLKLKKINTHIRKLGPHDHQLFYDSCKSALHIIA